jgi:hypothetical protein
MYIITKKTEPISSTFFLLVLFLYPDTIQQRKK